METSPLLPADWPAPRGVRGFTTLRYGAGVSLAPFDRFNLGNRTAMDGDDPRAVDANRAAVIGLAGLPAAPVWLRQVHGTAVLRAGAARAHKGAATPQPADEVPGVSPGTIEPEADAAVTAVPGTVLAILTADCLPVLFCADDGSEVGAAHAGWRGLASGVLEATVAAMETSPQRLIAWLGPAAGPQRYEVGGEVREAFVSRDALAENAFIATRPDHWNVDLYALAKRRLVQAGMRGDRIFGGDLCTISNPARFYSHRRDRRTGRMASMVWLQPDH